MPYILNTQKDVKEMLKAIGLKSVEELYAQLPEKIRLKDPLDIPPGLSEAEVKQAVTKLSEKNIPLEKFNSFLGAGCYDHYLPAALAYILSSPQFVSAYTPYQAECSQGALQAIYEYQSYICILTGMDISNASLFDGASSLAEAVLMSLRITGRKKILVAKTIHPEYLATLKTYLSGFDASTALSIPSVNSGSLEGSRAEPRDNPERSRRVDFILREIKPAIQGTVHLEELKEELDQNTACCVFQSPNFFGLIEDTKDIVDCAKEKKALNIMVTNPISLAIFKEPGLLGVDMVCGDGQPLGGSLNFGGPSFGFLTVKSEYLRQMPGRIVGETKDKEGNLAYCLTLQAREQHIRREKATSNICSNQSLNAIAAAVYFSLMGKDGLRKVALNSFNNTQYLYQRLKQVRGVRIPFGPRIFNEFLWEVDEAAVIFSKLYKRGIIAGFLSEREFPEYKNGIISCCTEKKTKDQIDHFIYSLAEILRG